MVLHFKLHKIIDFAFSNYSYLMEDSADEFFAITKRKKLSESTIQNISPLFNEWLMFEYRLPNGRTMALEYFAQNPDNLDPPASGELEQIIKSQFFDLFQILDWQPGKWIKAHSIYINKDYTIEDISLSNGLQEPGCFHLRIAKVNNTWITVGSNPLFIPITYTSRAQKLMAKQKSILSAKDIVSLYFPPKPQPVLTKKQIEGERRDLLAKFQKLKIKYKLSADF